MKNQNTYQARYDAYTLGEYAAYTRQPASANPYEHENYELYAEWIRGWTVETEAEQEHQNALDRQRARSW